MGVVVVNVMVSCGVWVWVYATNVRERRMPAARPRVIDGLPIFVDPEQSLKRMRCLFRRK